MNYNFNIEGDTLFLNVTTPTDKEDTFTIKKTPIINKEAFLACLNYWGRIPTPDSNPAPAPMPPIMRGANEYEPEIMDNIEEDEDDDTATE